jgi:hypothetical protein
MTLVNIPGGFWLPPPQRGSAWINFVNTSSVIDATGEKFAWIGRVWNKTRETKSIRKVGFRFGSVTKAGGSGLTISLQNVDTTNGPPYQPDGTQDQSVAIANADAGFVTNAYYLTGNLSADRSVAYGELIAVVAEYDGGGRLGADAVHFIGMSANFATDGLIAGPGCVLLTASWAGANMIPNILLEFSDGTYGTLDGARPGSSVTGVAFNSGSAADEIAMEFTVPFACKCDGAWIYLQAASGADFDAVLYEGTTAVATVSVDANAISAAASPRLCRVSWPEVTLSTSATYRLALKPTTGNNVTAYSINVADNAYLQAWPGGEGWVYTDRVDGGSWAAPTTTRRPTMGLRFSAIDDGAGSGGGGLKLVGTGGLAG